MLFSESAHKTQASSSYDRIKSRQVFTIYIFTVFSGLWIMTQSKEEMRRYGALMTTFPPRFTAYFIITADEISTVYDSFSGISMILCRFHSNNDCSSGTCTFYRKTMILWNAIHTLDTAGPRTNRNTVVTHTLGIVRHRNCIRFKCVHVYNPCCKTMAILRNI